MKTQVKCRSCGYQNEVSGLLSAKGDLLCVACGEYLFRISPTQILMLDRCPLSWFRKYVLGEDGPAASFPMERGRRFHADVANILNDAKAPLSFPAAHKYVEQLPRPVRATEEKRRQPLRYGVVEGFIDVIDQHGTICGDPGKLGRKHLVAGEPIAQSARDPRHRHSRTHARDNRNAERYNGRCN